MKQQSTINVYGRIITHRGLNAPYPRNTNIHEKIAEAKKHNIDDRVSSVSPQIGKQHRIYVGTVVVCNNHKYLIPLSHPVEKHKRMSQELILIR